MPYFKEKKILFIHIPKNAGMYIEKQLGIPSEIVSYEMPTDKKNIYRRSINVLKNFKNRINEKDKKIELEKKYIYGELGGSYSYQHASLSEIISYRMISKEELDNCIILAVHRHPVDRLVSMYNYWGFYKIMSFETFCEDIVLHPQKILDKFGILMHLKTQVSYINNSAHYSDKIHLLSFENLGMDFKKFIKEYNIKIDIENTKTNKSSNKTINNISANALAIIEEVYKDDFEYFGYTL